MSEWREETSADLAAAAEEIERASRSMSGEPTPAQLMSIWRAYLRVEKSIAFIKIELGDDNPGRFIALKGYAVPDERQALQFALRNLKKGSGNFSVGDLLQALKALRESRNYLRALLRSQRLKRARKLRSA